MYHVCLLIAASILLIQYARPTILCFLVLFTCCGTAYPILHVQYCKRPNYRRLSFDKKMYVLSNTIKGTSLAACTPMAMWLLYECMQGRWDTRAILVMGHMYAVLDTVSLFMVERMQFSTVVHHVAVFLVHVQNCQQDFSVDTYARCSVIYAIFSCFAFQVNLALARRYDNARFESAYVVYVLSCLLNWSWQLYYAWTHPMTLFGALWWVFMGAIVYDDVFLLRWLYKSM